VARSVNVYTSGWRATGATVAVPVYEQRVRVEWIDDTGKPHTTDETVRFPNVLTALPAADVREIVEATMMLEIRSRQKVDAVTTQVVER
jgi:hypothetical protein